MVGDDYRPPSSGVPMGAGYDETDLIRYATRVDAKKDGVNEAVYQRFAGMLSPHSAMANYKKEEYLAVGFGDSMTREFSVETFGDDSNMIFGTPVEAGLPGIILNYDSDEFTIQTHIDIINAYTTGIAKRTLGKDDKNNIFRVIKMNITEHTATSKHDESINERKNNFLGRARG
jgi:hypothetical protein